MESLKCISPSCLWDLIQNQYFVLQAGRKTEHKVNSTVFSIKWKILIPINISKLCICMGFPGGSSGKEFATNAGDVRHVVGSLGQEDPLEEGTATHSSILAWRIPWTVEPGRLQSIGSQRVRYD